MLFVLLGEAVLAASLPLLGLFALAVIVNAVYIPLSEEPGLAKRFGDDYLTYKQNVPRWIPRLTPWPTDPPGHDTIQQPHENPLPPRLAFRPWRRQADLPGEHGHEVINPKLPDEDFEEAVRIAQAEFDKHQPKVVVGSSRGGAVAMNIESGDARLVLLCPAWKKWGTARTVKPGTVILHSRADDVIPFADSEELVRNSGLPASALIEVGNDHRLADPEPLAAMLRACECRGDD